MLSITNRRRSMWAKIKFLDFKMAAYFEVTKNDFSMITFCSVGLRNSLFGAVLRENNQDQTDSCCRRQFYAYFIEILGGGETFVTNVQTII